MQQSERYSARTHAHPHAHARIRTERCRSAHSERFVSNPKTYRKTHPISPRTTRSLTGSPRRAAPISPSVRKQSCIVFHALSLSLSSFSDINALCLGWLLKVTPAHSQAVTRRIISSDLSALSLSMFPQTHMRVSPCRSQALLGPRARGPGRLLSLLPAQTCAMPP